MIVCKHCLKEIEAHNGKQVAMPVPGNVEVIEIGFDECVECEWCNEYVPKYQAVEI